MKKLILILTLILSSFLNAFTGKVTSVHDGDTIKVTTKTGEKFKIRFYGLDSPEVDPKQEYGLEARDYLNSLIYNKEVEIKVKDKDRYGRTVGEVFYKGESINLDMIKNGYAWHYKHHAPNRFDFKEAEFFAKTNKKGLWKGNPIAPWVFRKLE
ncbi:MAG: thermonuclease family protein [Fusobacteriaceae bacterium]